VAMALPDVALPAAAVELSAGAVELSAWMSTGTIAAASAGAAEASASWRNLLPPAEVTSAGTMATASAAVELRAAVELSRAAPPRVELSAAPEAF